MARGEMLGLRGFALGAVVGATLGVAALAAPAAQAAEPEPPRYEVVVEQNVYIPMPDGTKLAADIYRPKAEPGTRFPCLLELTPYRKEPRAEEGAGFFPGRGFVFAEVDARGSGGSEGEYDVVFSPQEQRDAADAIEWLATRYDWCSGKVGMFGGSYSGIIQYLTAALAPPHLLTIAPQRAYGDLYRDIVYVGGVLTASFGALWSAGTTAFNAQGADLQTNPPPEQWLKSVVQHNTRNSPMFGAYLNAPYDGEFYRASSLLPDVKRLRVPTFHVAGWFDAFTRGQLRVFQEALRLERAGEISGPHHLAIGPWSHTGTHALAYPELAADLLAWYRHWLEGAPRPAFMRGPRVRYFEMDEARNGGGRWREAKRWPPSRTKFDRLYLRADGSLSGDRPAADEASRSFDWSPLTGISEWPSKWDDAAGALPMAERDQTTDEASGLTYTTPVLERDLVVTGPIALHLRAATEPLEGGATIEPAKVLETIAEAAGQHGVSQLLPPRNDNDWVVKLAEVAADGSSTLIQEGYLRASHRALDERRTTWARGEALVPFHPHTRASMLPVPIGEPYELDIEIWPTAKRFHAGNRLRIAIYASDLPNHFTQLRPVRDTVFHDHERPSYLLLARR